MRHLRSLAGAAALALYALGCVPVSTETKPDPLTESTAGGEDQRFGDVAERDIAGSRTVYKTSFDGTRHTPHVNTEAAGTVNTTYVVDADSNTVGTQNFPTISVTSYSIVCLQVVMGNGSTPVGSYSVETSIDGAIWDLVYIDANRVYGENFSAFSGGTTIGVSSPAGTVGISFCIENPGPNIRLTYTRTSGGAADTIDAYSFIRSM